MSAVNDGQPSMVLNKQRPWLPGKRALRGVGRLIFFLSVILLFSCAGKEIRQPPARGDQSEIQVYLQPAPPEIRRLQWTLGDLTAMRSDGGRVPLTLAAKDLNGSELEGKQTHLASGFLPSGSYKGISLEISEATIRREDGEAALLVPDDPITVAGPFELEPSQVLPLFLSLGSAGLVTGGFRFSPSFSLAFPARELDSLTGYLALPQADRITTFDRKTLQVIGTIATGRAPHGISVDPVLGRAYVALSEDDAVQIIDVFQGTTLERISLRTGDGPRDLALTGDGRTLLSVNYASNTLSLIDPVRGIETERIEVSQGPTSVIVDRNGTRAYVTCSLSGTVAVIDLSTGSMSANVSLEETTPVAAALDREEEQLFVVSTDSPNLAVVDANTLVVTDRIYVGTGAVSVTLDELSGLVLVGRKYASEVSIVDPSVLMPVDSIRLRGAAGHMIVDSQEKALLVTVPGKKLLQKINLVSKRVMAEMAMDAFPSEVAVVE